MKHILFIVGSLRKHSFNRLLAAIAEDLLKDRFEISYLDFKDIPYMNQDWESQQTTDNSLFLEFGRKLLKPTASGYLRQNTIRVIQDC